MSYPGSLREHGAGTHDQVYMSEQKPGTLHAVTPLQYKAEGNFDGFLDWLRLLIEKG